VPSAAPRRNAEAGDFQHSELKILQASGDAILSGLLGEWLKKEFAGCSIRLVSQTTEMMQLEKERFDLRIVDAELLYSSPAPHPQPSVRTNLPNRVAVLVATDKEYPLHQLLREPVGAVIHRRDGIGPLRSGLLAVLNGGSYLSPTVQMLRTRMSSDPDFFGKILSNRELEILELQGRGFSTAAIARKLRIARATVADHRKNFMVKLGLHSQGEVFCYCLARGII
jgi:DNA-binding NarL/FixJ family response regulator